GPGVAGVRLARAREASKVRGPVVERAYEELLAQIGRRVQPVRAPEVLAGERAVAARDPRIVRANGELLRERQIEKGQRHVEDPAHQRVGDAVALDDEEADPLAGRPHGVGDALRGGRIAGPVWPDV